MYIILYFFKEALSMDDMIRKRCVEIGECMVATGKTVRQLATMFKVSKSTVHKDLTDRLPLISPFLAGKVRTVLDKHREIRHILVGHATREHWKALKGKT